MKQFYKRILYSIIILFALLFSNKASAQYAISGTAGDMVKSVYWLRWDPSTMLSHPVAFSSTSSNVVAGTYEWQYSPTSKIIAVLSNFSGNAPIKPYTPGNYSGDGLDLIYSGNNLAKPNSRGVDFSGISVSQSTGNTGLGIFDIDIKVQMLINNVWTDINFPGMIIGDAESIDGSGEYFSGKTSATAWQLLNKHTNSPTTDPTYALTLSNSGKDFKVNVTSGSGNLGIQAVMYAHGVHKITDVQMKGSGTTAIALGFVFPFDLGDAPATYGNAVAHYIDTFTYNPFTSVADGTFPIVTYTTATLVPKANVYIGSDTPTGAVDADGTAVHTPLADGDNDTQNDDESTLSPSGLVDIKVNQSGDYVIPQFQVTNLNATPAKVYMWLDFNNDGVFSDDEVQIVSVPANTTNFNVNITFPNSQFASKIKAGPLYGRIRITGSAISDDPATTNIDERSTAFAGDGETEDYKFKDILGLTISGKVVNDGNGKTDNVISGTGLNTLGAATITAYLLDNSTGLIVAKTPIAADGTYSFTNIANNGTFIVAISTVTTAVVGDNIATIPANLPTGWNAVGEAFGVNNNVTGIETGTPNLHIQIVTPGTSLDVTNVDFALDQTPVAVDDNSGTTDIDVNISVDILANDTDPNGNNTINLTSVKLIDPADGLEKTVVTTTEGVYTVNATTGAVTFDPVSTFTGTTGSTAATTIKYTVLDNAGVKSNQATLTVKVKPVGVTDNVSTLKDVAITTTVKANDDNGVVSLTTVISTDTTNPTNGVIVVNSDGTIKYTPNNGYTGSDSYTYRLTSPDGTVKSDPITVNITVYNPKITLTKEGTYNDFNADGKVSVGDRINYTFVVTNTGTVAVTNITITDANATITGGPIASLAVAGVDNSTFTGFHTLTQAEIDNGGVFNLATATGKDPNNNNVTATSNDPTPLDPTDPNYPVTPPTPACPTCTITPLVQTGAMTLAKEGIYNDFNADGKVSVGDRINYTFVVTNTGNVTLTNVTIADPSATITGGPIASLAVGASNNNTFTGFHTLTQADIDNSGVYNLATATGKDPKNNNVTATSNDPTPLDPADPNYPVTPPTPACPTCTITPLVQTGTLSLLKAGTYNDFNADGKVSVGDRINYTFVVTNTGNVTLTNVTITDANATISGGPIATLAVGASNNNTFTGFHTLTQSEIDNGGVYNLATATAKDPKDKPVTATSNDPTPLDPADPNYPVTPPTPACPTCTITPLVQTGTLSLLKEGTYNDFNAEGKVSVGDRINYTFVVTNTGNVTLTNVTVTDPSATITGGPIATLAVGATDNTTFTGFHTLTQADIDNSGVYNLATATGKDPKNNNVTATSNDPTPLDPADPNYPVTPPTPACPTCTITPLVQTGTLSLLKEGTYNDFNADGKVSVGDRINYTFVVTNTGNVTLTNVTIADPSATITGGPIASLAVGASNNNTFTGFHTLTQADIDNSGVYNLATATGKDPKNNNVTATSNDPTPLGPADPNYPVTPPTPACPTCTITPLVQTGAMTLAKDGSYNDFNANGKVDAGDRINYTFVVTNTGNVTLTNVTITDANATITGGPIATLAVGATDNTTFTGFHTLIQADLDNSGVYNLATATGKDPKNNNVTATSNDPTPLDPADPNYPVTPPTPACPTCTITPLVQTGAMTLAKEGTYNDFNADGKVSVGDRINYTFVVTNTGNVTLTNVTIADPSATITGGPIATLAVGATDNTTFTGFHTLTQADIDNSGVYNLATATGKDPKNNNVTATSNDPTPLDPTDPNYPVTPPTPACPTCTITPLVQTGAMTLAKDGSYNDFNANGKVDAGDRINYTFVVTNTGNVTLTNVTITDANATITGGPIATLAVGATDNTTFTGFHTLIQADLDNSGVYNLATATGKDPKNNNVTATSNDPTPLDPADPNYPVTPPTPACPTCTITPLVQTGTLSLLKEGTYNDFNADGKLSVGDRINYTFVVTNTGNVTLTNVTVTDPSATITGGPIATLAVGAIDNTTFTGFHTLTQADIDNSGVYNLATATGKDPKNNNITTTSKDPTPLDPTDPNYPVTPPTPACPTCTITTIVQEGKLSLLKDGTYNDTNGDGKVNVGDRINYTFVVTNTGNVTLTNITVTDPDAVMSGGPLASLAVGAQNNTTFTGYHILTQADIDNGGVFNLATAKGKDPKGKDVTTTSNDPTPLVPGSPTYPFTPPTPACPTCTVTPTVQSPSMTLTKDGAYADTNADGIVNVGDRINYTFVVTNTGNVTLTNVVITDPNAAMAGGPLATLAPGASNSTTFTAYHILTQGDIDNRGVFNLATASAKDPRGNTITKTSTDPTPLAPTSPLYPIVPPVPACTTCTVTPIVQTGAIALVKTVTNTGTGVGGAFVLGNSIQYTFTITNTGNVSLSNITLVDAKLATGTINIAGTLLPGASTTVVRSYTITAADIAAGNVTNTATVNATTPAGTPVTDVSGSTNGNNTPTVTTLGKPPVATNDSATTLQNNAVKITIQTNDVAGSSPIVVGSVVITVQPLHGTLIINADGTVTYTPTNGYVGPDSFTYTVTDANGQISNPAVVSITVTPSMPKALDDNAKTTFSKPVTIPIIANDSKDVAPFDLTTIEIVSQPLHGTVKVNLDGTVTYAPNDGYTGTETFTYRLKDAYGNYTNIATVTILVDGTFFSNVITPDGDGKNDVWVIVGSNNYDRIEVEFFNRWGNQVYINKNYKNDWDGDKLNEGTYYYTARLYKGSTYTTAKGWVLVKR